MENYIKAVLHVYPFLKTAEKTYAQHIQNKALLSCDGRMDTEKLAEYLAKEILHKRRLEWLKQVMDRVLSRLSDTERLLIDVHFFGEKRKLRLLQNKAIMERLTSENWSERKRFRFQSRCLKKIEAMLRCAGITKKLFEEELLEIELVKKIYERLLRSGA